MPRNSEIKVKLNRDEYDKVKKKAEDASISMSALIRYLVLKSKIKVSDE